MSKFSLPSFPSFGNKKKRPGNNPQNGHRFETLEPRNLLATVSVFAAGQTGDEAFNLIVNNQIVEVFENVGGDIDNREFARFDFHTDGFVSADQVQVEFFNDAAFEGYDRNLWIDCIVIDGVGFQTEASSTHSTGFYSDGEFTGDGFFETEILNVNGTFSYLQQVETGTTIRVDALGETGDENLQLLVDGDIVKNFRFTHSDTPHSFYYNSDDVVDLSQVKIRFTNDQLNSETGYDRNLQVFNFQAIDLETGNREIARPTDANVFSNAVYNSEDGVVPGYGRGDTLVSNGFIEAQASTRIRVIASGDTGQELMEIRIGEDFSKRVQVSEHAQSYFLTVPRDVAIQDVQIAFLNDFRNENTGFDRNLVVHSFQTIDVDTLDREIARPTDANVFSNGTYLEADGVVPGFGRGNTLNSNGYFQVRVNSNQGYQVSQTFGGDPYLVRTDSPSGKFIVVEGTQNENLREETLTLFNKNGSRVAGFGQNGMVKWADVADSVGVEFSSIRDVDVLSDGTVLVTAHRIPRGGRSLPFLLRLNANGSVDHTFGANGLLTQTPVGGDAGDVGTLTSLMETDGHVTVIGNSGASDTSVSLVHLDEHGDVDPAYGANGRLTLSANVLSGGLDISGRTLLGAVALSDNSVFVVTKLFTRGLAHSVSVLKLDDLGRIDRSFGQQGRTIISSLGGFDTQLIGLDSQNRILLGSGQEIVRINATGGMDNSFGTSGILNLVSIDGFVRSNILLDKLDRILIIGNRIAQPNPRSGVEIVGSNIIRYTEAGILDRSFDHDGIQSFDDSSFGFTSELDINGNLLVGVGQTGTDEANFRLSSLKLS